MTRFPDAPGFFVTLQGDSMAPGIPDGATLDVEPAAPGATFAGEVVVFERGGRLTAHRCVADLGGTLLERGDAGGPVGAVARPAVAGVARRVFREEVGDWLPLPPRLTWRQRLLASTHRCARRAGMGRMPGARSAARWAWARLGR